MIINKDYILSRIVELVEEKQKTQQQIQNEGRKLYDIKQKFPSWSGLLTIRLSI